jgi:hypothetical protein
VPGSGCPLFTMQPPPYHLRWMLSGVCQVQAKPCPTPGTGLHLAHLPESLPCPSQALLKARKVTPNLREPQERAPSIIKNWRPLYLSLESETLTSYSRDTQH